MQRIIQSATTPPRFKEEAKKELMVFGKAHPKVLERVERMRN